ncbi:zinc metalloproteinase nas-1-like [Daphnia pulex]|uniref:zinc metalloproteinase nas-1-like n=1 Tax=Daphnia pulex TaxID=6669 RepID=UPI001EDCED9C|nr:zinc metalloproteinase nas-1-like [Daphnia pulex]
MQDDSLKALKPLTEEEFNSGATGNKGASLKNRPWEHQEGGDVPPNNGNKKNGDVNLISVSKLAAQERKVIASAMWIITRKPVSALSPAKRKVITSRSSGAENPKLGGWLPWKGHMGGAQELSLDSGWVHFSVVIHELMHAIGFDHEQECPDQSRYITVNFDNIKKGKLFVC